MTAEMMLLGGERVPAAEGKTFEVVEPGTGGPMAEVAEGALRTLSASSTSRRRRSMRDRGRGPLLAFAGEC